MKKVLITLGLTVISVSAFAAAKDSILQNWNHVAINGYDAVSYFTSKQPTKGSSNYMYCWHCAKWYFANEQDMEMFKKNPTKYAPQYGGWCAYAAAMGYVVKSDPEAWSIYKGKLYLNLNKKVRAQWLQKVDQYIQTADQKWPQLIKANKVKTCKAMRACEATI